MIGKKETNEHFLNVGDSKGGLIRPGETLAAFKFFYDSGHAVALRDAISYCLYLTKTFPHSDDSHLLTKRYFFPDWVLQGISEMIEQSYTGKGIVLGKGKYGNSNAFFRNQQNHLARYLVVLDAREEKDGNGKVLKGFAAFERACELLVGATAEADIDQVRKSYHKVKREIGSEKFAKDYYPLIRPIGDFQTTKSKSGKQLLN